MPRKPKTDREQRREDELRHAVRAAERDVKQIWHARGRKRISADDLDARCAALNTARATARAAAREQVRARWAKEDALYPSHITRLTAKPSEPVIGGTKGDDLSE
jgi:hypothetical protein